MSYILIAFLMLVIIAPIIAILPSAKQKAQMAKRQQAMAGGIQVELTKIDDPDPDPEKYLSNTGKPLERRMSVAAYRIPRKRPVDWRQAPSTDWAANRVRQGSEVIGAAVPAVGWLWDGSPDASLANDLSEFIAANLVGLPNDVARVEEKKYVISVFWQETDEVSQIIDFLESCAAVRIEMPEDPTIDSDDFSV